MENEQFILKRPVSFGESMTCEFKEVKASGYHSIGDRVDEYVVAYLNTLGGSIYWGISDDRNVSGVKLSEKKCDELNQVVGVKVGAIFPPVDPRYWSLTLHPVVDPKDNSVAADTYVVEVRVDGLQGKPLFITGNGASFRRLLGGIKKLTGPELREAIYSELEAKKAENLKDLPDSEGIDVSWMPSVERRAKVVRPLLRGSRVLWVDDNPGDNLYERTLLTALGVSIDVALSTKEAKYLGAKLPYDLILSDITRGSNACAGLEMLSELRQEKIVAPLIYYVGRVDPEKPPPMGAFAITNKPDELLHFVFDVLERRSSEAG